MTSLEHNRPAGLAPVRNPNEMRRKSDLECIEYAIRVHPKGCVFMPGAAERILELVGGRLEFNSLDNDSWVKMLRLAFETQEVYCPHEPNRTKHIWGVC